MISTTRSIALLAALVTSLVSTSALAQAGIGLDSPTGGPRRARPAEPAPAQPPAAPPSSPAPSTSQAPSSQPSTSPPPTAPSTSPPPAPEPETTPAPEVAHEPAAPPPTEAPPAAPGAEAGAEEIVPPPAPPTDGPQGERMRMLVVDAATFGIDPVVGRVASARMRSTAEEMGYHVLTQEETIAAAQQLRMPYPPTPADLWRVSWVARAHRGAFARIWAHSGQYVIEITVASLDGAGPFFARGTSGASDLRDVVDRLLRTALPSTTTWNAAAAAGVVPGVQPAAPGAAAAGGGRVAEIDTEAPPIARRSRRATGPQPELRRWQLTLQTEGAIGAAQDIFYNHLVGLRFDFRITRDILIGAYAAYANLNARNGRADNMLFMAQFENRIRISPDLDLTIPLRVGVGYLPFNGPVVRLAAGVNYAIDEHFEIGADLLTPTFWVLPDRTAVSLNIAIEGTYRF